MVTQPHRAVTVTVKDRPPSEVERREQEEIAKLFATRLDRARKAAEGWRAGQAALLGLITTVSVVKGPDAVAGLPVGVQIVIGVVLAAALACGITSIVCFTNAAYGRLEDVDLNVPPGLRLEQWRTTQLNKARDDINVALVLTYVTLALLAVAIGLSWYVPRDDTPAARPSASSMR